jgi:hypothetical protein
MRSRAEPWNMELLLSIGKELLALPVWALIQAPFIRWAARFAKTAPVSFRAAIMLGLITGAVTLAISLALYPAYWLLPVEVVDGLSLAAGLAAAAWLYGYFLRDETGHSAGIARGFVTLILEMLMLFGALVVVSVLGVLLHIGGLV